VAAGEQEILAFDTVQNAVDLAAYRWDVWGAAYLINGGCSDDGFDYFRGWLMAQGRRTWDETLADPDSLASLLEGAEVDDYEGEAMTAVASSAYEELTGDAEAFWTAVQELDQRPSASSRPGGGNGPAGDSFDFDDPAQMRARFPRLAEMFLSDD